MDYAQFLASKRLEIKPAGFEVSHAEINPLAFGYQRDIIQWSLRKGRAGVFPQTGTGKTLIQLEIARLVRNHTNRHFLILAPLAVSRQTLMEAKKFGIDVPVKVCVSQSDVDACEQPTICITNYEKLHKFDINSFDGVALDEASCIKDATSKTRDRVISAFHRTPYRFCLTATPSPNDIMEIGSYCEFLGIMTRAEMLAMFFIHDGGDTSKWRLKRHAEKDFFRWMASWSVMMQKPSDIGYSDDGFDLPPLNFYEHVIETNKIPEGFLFQIEARTLSEQRQARRDSLDDRTAFVAELANANSKEPWIVWTGLNDESTAAAALIKDCVEVTGSQKDWEKERNLLSFVDQHTRALVSKARICGWGMNLQFCSKMAFLGINHSFESQYQSIRRCWRFGQKKPVDVHFVISDRDGAILENIKRKQVEFDRLAEGMIAAMGDLTKAELGQSKRESMDYNPQVPMRIPDWLKPYRPQPVA